MQSASKQVPKRDLSVPILTTEDCLAVLELSKLIDQTNIAFSKSNKNREEMGILDNNGRWIKY